MQISPSQAQPQYMTKHPNQQSSPFNQNPVPPQYEIHIYSASDHPCDWDSMRGFHLIDYTPATRSHLQNLLTAGHPALRIFSVHWGPNYKWRPGSDIVSLAHFLVECGVDIVHGHSAHHV
jgi:hypothetical protein